MNLVLAGVIAYVVNYAKRSAELSAEEGVSDKTYLKKLIRESVAETRDVLTELRVHEFNIPTGRRKLSRMNSLVEKLSLVDEELANRVWALVNAPTLVNLAEEAYKKVESDVRVQEYKHSLFENSQAKERNELLKYLFENCKLDKGNVVTTLNSPFDVILQANKTQNWLRGEDVTRIEKIVMEFLKTKILIFSN